MLSHIRVDPRDNVAIVVNPEGFSARERIPQSHKIALSDLAVGEPVLRYGQIIGYANREMQSGSWVRGEFLNAPAARQIHGNDTLEIAWTVAPSLFLFAVLGSPALVCPL